MKAGIHAGLPMSAYLTMPAASASLLLTAVDECPYAAWWQSWMNPRAPARDSDSTAATDAGTIAHSVLLEGSTQCVAVINPEEHQGKKGGVPKGWTNDAMREARDAAIAAGKVPVLPHQMRLIEAMVDTARAFIESLRTTEPAIWAAFQPEGGDSEATMTWEDDGIAYRARPDRISKDRLVVIDYKTTAVSAEPSEWGRKQLVGMGFYAAAAHYRRGLKVLTGGDAFYGYLVQEQSAPFLCSLVGIDPAGRDLGDRKIARARTLWAGCIKAGAWPKYPNRAVYPEFPVYEFSREESAESQNIEYDVAKLWRKPTAEERAFDELPD